MGKVLNIKSDNLIVSVYSGVRQSSFGLENLTGIDTKLMYKNFSANLGLTRGNNKNYSMGKYTGTSVGIKVYDLIGNKKNKLFIGLNRMVAAPYGYYFKFYYYYAKAITVGYRHITSSGLYLFPYTGVYTTGTSYMRHHYNPCLGLSVGHQFPSINLNNVKK